MKNRPVSALENCCDSAMLPPAATIAPVIACTIPGSSRQTRERTQGAGRLGRPGGGGSLATAPAYRGRSSPPYAGRDMQHPAAPFPTLGLITLAGAVFVSITGEFLPTGLLPDMADGLGVSVSQAGILITVFAATVVLATTPLALLTREVSRKTLVFWVLLVNALATLLAAMA